MILILQNNSTNESFKTVVIIIISILCFILLNLFFIILYIYNKSKRKKTHPKNDKSIKNDLENGVNKKPANINNKKPANIEIRKAKTNNIVNKGKINTIKKLYSAPKIINNLSLEKNKLKKNIKIPSPKIQHPQHNGQILILS